MDIEKTIKIVGANKNVRKSFSTIKEAKTHISKNKLVPVSNKSGMGIEVTTVKYHKVDVKAKELSKSIKETLLQVLKDNIKDIDFRNLRVAGNIHDTYMYNDKSVYKKFLRDFIQERYNVTDADMKAYYSKYSWSDGGIKAPFDDELHDDKVLAEMGPIVIGELINNSNLKDIEFRYIQTNYKPCHNINVVIGGESFQIRVDDIRFSEGQVTGRNVSVSKVMDLTDDRFESFFKTTIFSKK